MKTPSHFPTAIDHLVYTATNLEQGMDRIEQMLGMRPVLGGRHPNFGTHNALLSIGPTTYLEIIAPDPGIGRPDLGLVFGMDDTLELRLATWALRTEDIGEDAAFAAAKGLDLGAVEPGSRKRPDGTWLSWRLTDPRRMLLDGSVPFLIDWRDTPHPAGSTPRAGELIGLNIGHPNPQRVRRALGLLGVDLDVTVADSPTLTATIQTEQGAMKLR